MPWTILRFCRFSTKRTQLIVADLVSARLFSSMSLAALGIGRPHSSKGKSSKVSCTRAARMPVAVRMAYSTPNAMGWTSRDATVPLGGSGIFTMTATCRQSTRGPSLDARKYRLSLSSSVTAQTLSGAMSSSDHDTGRRTLLTALTMSRWKAMRPLPQSSSCCTDPRRNSCPPCMKPMSAVRKKIGGDSSPDRSMNVWRKVVSVPSWSR
mmetsp:Transcript_39441/g.112486  ORF Transcript_39441/g.112486 Transcript_39441/m.112486 type:complete len:209 (-) Transcript_39441:854-1480(-)